MWGATYGRNGWVGENIFGGFFGIRFLTYGKSGGATFRKRQTKNRFFDLGLVDDLDGHLQKKKKSE